MSENIPTPDSKSESAAKDLARELEDILSKPGQKISSLLALIKLINRMSN